MRFLGIVPYLIGFVCLQVAGCVTSSPAKGMVMQTCRFCKSSKNEDQMVKYEVRHYAHFECYLRAKKPLSRLWAWQIKQFPYRLLKQYGFLNEAQTLIAEENRRDWTPEGVA